MRASLPAGRALLALDLLIAAWIVLWVVLGIRIGQEVRNIGRISATVAKVGRAVADTGDSLAELHDLPLIGDRIADAAKPIRDAGVNARASALQSRRSARDLSWLLGIAIAVVPSLPLLALYVPGRVAMRRDREAVGRAFERDEPELQRTLAQRAVVHLSFHRLRAVTRTPHADLAEGRYEELARAELERLGLNPPRHLRGQGSTSPRRIA